MRPSDRAWQAVKRAEEAHRRIEELLEMAFGPEDERAGDPLTVELDGLAMTAEERLGRVEAEAERATRYQEDRNPTPAVEAAERAEAIADGVEAILRRAEKAMADAKAERAATGRQEAYIYNNL